MMLRVTDDSTKAPELETLELMNNEISGRLSRQSAALSQIDTKAAILGGLAVAGTQFLASKTPDSTALQVWAFVLFGIAFVTAVLTYSLARFIDVPYPDKLIDDYVFKTKTEILSALITTRADAFEKNAGTGRRKVTFWWVSVGALALAILLSVLAMVHHGSHEQPDPKPSGRAVVERQ